MQVCYPNGDWLIQYSTNFIFLIGCQFFYFAFGMIKDFCMGGSYPGSPEGTLLTILTDHDFETSGITYKAFKFYTGVSFS